MMGANKAAGLFGKIKSENESQFSPNRYTGSQKPIQEITLKGISISRKVGVFADVIPKP